MLSDLPPVRRLVKKAENLSPCFLRNMDKLMKNTTHKIKNVIKKIPGVMLVKAGVDFLWFEVIKKALARREHRSFFPSKRELKRQRRAPGADAVLFSIVVPLYNTPIKFLTEMIESVIAQTYPNWELCLADGSEDKKVDSVIEETVTVEEICRKYAADDTRIKYKKLDKNLGISGNSNKGIEMATGDYIALLDHDDIIWPNALYENAAAIRENGAEILYSDEDHIDEDGLNHTFPFLKPNWSRDLLYSQNYICHFLVFKADLLKKTGGFDPAFDGGQDYDFILRLSEYTERIYHIPKILYSWRETLASTALNFESKPYTQDAGLNALNAHLKRRYDGIATAYPAEVLLVWDTRFDTMNDQPLVSIIIPMRDKADLTEQCIQSIIGKSTYKNWEIILVDNGSSEAESLDWLAGIENQDNRIRVVKADFEFNWSKINNFGIQNASGDVFIFLNNDTIVISPDWIERLSENALRDDIGAVGPMLLYEDDTIQHVGAVVGLGGWADHVYKGVLPVHTNSPFVSPVINRNVLAVTGACLCISRSTIERIGSFSEEFIICGSDVELCIRAYESGLRNLYNANVRLYHLESKSRDSYIPKVDFEMSARAYKPYRENTDPFFNPNLDINSVVPRALPSSSKKRSI